MECERRSIGANIDSLIDFGFDITKTQAEYFLRSGEFEPSEIQFLVDAVFSSKSIDGRHSRDLANKLSKFLSTYQRKQYNYVYKASENIYMFGTKTITATIKISDNWATAYVDEWFGKNARFYEKMKKFMQIL